MKRQHSKWTRILSRDIDSALHHDHAAALWDHVPVTECGMCGSTSPVWHVPVKPPCGASAINALVGHVIADESTLRATLLDVGQDVEDYIQNGASTQVLLAVLAVHGLGQVTSRTHRGHAGFTASLDPRTDSHLLLNDGSHWTALYRTDSGWDDNGEATKLESDLDACDYVARFAERPGHWVIPIRPFGMLAPPLYRGPEIRGFGSGPVMPTSPRQEEALAEAESLQRGLEIATKQFGQDALSLSCEMCIEIARAERMEMGRHAD